MMQSVRATQWREMLPPKRVLALALLGLFCSLHLLAIVPFLHECVHGEDAGGDDHYCAITILAKGQVAGTTITEVLADGPAVALAEPFPELSFHYSCTNLLPDNRGPPLFPS